MTIHNNKFYHQLSKVTPLDDIEEDGVNGDNTPRTRCRIQVSLVDVRCTRLSLAENGFDCRADCDHHICIECCTCVLCILLSARVRHTCECDACAHNCPRACVGDLWRCAILQHHLVLHLPYTLRHWTGACVRMRTHLRDNRLPLRFSSSMRLFTVTPIPTACARPLAI
jgi:hypothetical protein